MTLRHRVAAREAYDVTFVGGFGGESTAASPAQRLRL